MGNQNLALADSERPVLIYERFSAARELAGYGIGALAREIGISDRYLNYLARGERPASEWILVRLRELLGDNGFDFAIGRVRSLHAPKAPTAKAA